METLKALLREIWAALHLFAFLIYRGIPTLLVIFFKLVFLVMATPHELLNPRPDERYKKLDDVDPLRKGTDFRRIIKRVLAEYAKDSGGSIPKSKFNDVTRSILERIVLKGVSFLHTSSVHYYYGWWVFIPAEQVPSIIEPIDWKEYAMVYGAPFPMDKDGNPLPTTDEDEHS